MRAVALAIILTGIGLERAIRIERPETTTPERVIAISFMICLIFGV